MKQKDFLQYHLTMMFNFLHNVISIEENESKRLAYITFDTRIKEAVKELKKIT